MYFVLVCEINHKFLYASNVMSANTTYRGVSVIIDKNDFHSLFEVLHRRGYDIFGPTIKDQAIVYDAIASVDDLPIGWVDRQGNGIYHLSRHRRKFLFGYVVGPHSWKQILYPPNRKLFEARRNGNGYELIEESETPSKRALIGVRSCELHALDILDRVLLDGPYRDPSYGLRRENLFVVAVNCTRTGGTCFCASMNTGPRATSGFDLALTEILDNDDHYFVATVGSDAGANLLTDIPHRKASEKERQAEQKAIDHAASRMGRHLDVTGLEDLLNRNFDSPRWEKTAARCLSCGNCTMVCPTCFCANVEDNTDLTGDTVSRCRRWDSCYNIDFSYLHGGSVRSSVAARYRQWMMHKLAYWPQQYGTFGCVGCGRCITWCPVGIDLTEEARAIRKSE